ncbi:hypothetical protein V1512DRAFT_258363 [Lipomyces arxii]|uniref:uncharacterized protein n=1 Tax=Lipomyces arxii TaxID=56418 RepID=UPI0034CD7328
MGSAISRTSRRYPTGPERGLGSIVNESIIRSNAAKFREGVEKQVVPERPAIEPESVESAILPARRTYDETRKERANDPDLGLEEFPVGGEVTGEYSHYLNDMLKKLGPINIDGNVTQSNNLQMNPVARMFKARDEINARGQHERQDVTTRRTLFSASELAEIIELGKRGWTRTELEEHFHMDRRVLDEMGTAFVKFKAKNKFNENQELEDVKEKGKSDDESFQILMEHGRST